ncbi:cell division protein ZapA [Litorimonas sp. RW-G-Af-16]|uniref:cell division protein ZapA n=1 Tax=Litorimonas sp. RW-G-Af-16 TaxID=3241168 RepID=UPI00390CB327
MGKVSLNINGRKYGMGCEDGEEERLIRLGQKLDDRVNLMANQFGQIGDIRLMVMAGITLLDELEDINSNVDAQVDLKTGQLRSENTQLITSLTRTETKSVNALESAAEKIERLVARLSEGDP